MSASRSQMAAAAVVWNMGGKITLESGKAVKI
jgi:hypothetical protein